MTDMSLLMGLSALAFILGFIAGIAVCKRHPDPEYRPRDPLARDVHTPGSKLVALPDVRDYHPHVKPSSAWPRYSLAAGESARVPAQRVQDQVENLSRIERVDIA